MEPAINWGGSGWRRKYISEYLVQHGRDGSGLMPELRGRATAAELGVRSPAFEKRATDLWKLRVPAITTLLEQRDIPLDNCPHKPDKIRELLRYEFPVLIPGTG
jgi:hypothetical protein